MAFNEAEKRKHPRADARFIVSYRIIGADDKCDITQTKNLSLGGMLLTTNRQFTIGTNLALEIKLPFDPNSIKLIGKVVESREIVKKLIYDTRIMFLAIEEKHRNIIGETVKHYIGKEK